MVITFIYHQGNKKGGEFNLCLFVYSKLAAERKAVFRSTAFPADKILVRGSNLDKLVDEILGIIKN